MRQVNLVNLVQKKMQRACKTTEKSNKEGGVLKKDATENKVQKSIYKQK